jgi:hypothetical protein
MPYRLSNTEPLSGWEISQAKGRDIGSWLMAHFQANNARSAPFLCVCVGMSLVNNISKFPLEKFRAAKLVVLLSHCERESGSESG